MTDKAWASLSARRAWIEIQRGRDHHARSIVALRKESVDRNFHQPRNVVNTAVALRKESVDRNTSWQVCTVTLTVALRKESVDRNPYIPLAKVRHCEVALRKESVDRNDCAEKSSIAAVSLSARRAWIEIYLPVIL